MTTLLLTGWTQDPAALKPIAPEGVIFDYGNHASPQGAFEGLRHYHNAEHVIGWSLGGQIALRAIERGLIAPKRLTLLATPVQFVRNADFDEAMDAFTFQQFYDNYQRDPARTKRRFHGLVAKGDRHAERVMAELIHHPEVEDTGRWLRWLDELGAISLKDMKLPNAPQTVIVHGDKDAIVPPAQALALKALIPQARLELWENAGHAPHAHDRARLMALIG